MDAPSHILQSVPASDVPIQPLCHTPQTAMQAWNDVHRCSIDPPWLFFAEIHRAESVHGACKALFVSALNQLRSKHKHYWSDTLRDTLLSKTVRLFTDCCLSLATRSDVAILASHSGLNILCPPPNHCDPFCSQS
jgi:hypothetical protein